MDIVSIVDKNLLRLQEIEKEKHKEDERDAHYPSSASIKRKVIPKKGEDSVYGACLLAEWRKWRKIPETNPPTVNTLQKFAWGTIFHNWITEILKKECLAGGYLRSLENEVSFALPVAGLTYPVKGRIDNILNKNVILEIKSSFGKFFFARSGLIAVGPRKGSLMQTLCYLKAREDLEYAILLYIARDVGFKMQYNVYRKGNSIIVTHWEKGQEIRNEYPEITWDAMIERWAELEDYLKNDKEPPRDFQFKTKYPCCYCPFYSMCWTGKQTKSEVVIGQGGE